MAEFVVIILAILSGFVPAYLLDGIVVSKINEGVMKKNYGDHQTVNKATGVFLIIIEFAIGAFIGYQANEYFEQVYTISGEKIWLWIAPVGFFLILGARIKVGGNWGWKEVLFLAVFLIGSVALVYYGFGGDTQPNSP